MAMQSDKSPVFPLNTVLFPHCRLPLQLFEQRYLSMVADCMKQDRGFVIAFISKGYEVGLAPEIFSIGTEVKIIDWNQLDNGMLGITVEGVRRVQVEATEVLEDNLIMAQVTPLPEPTMQTSEQSQELSALLQQLQQHPMVQRYGQNVDYDDPVSVIWCVSGLLPLSNSKKQYLLEIDDANMRLSALMTLLKALESE